MALVIPNDYQLIVLNFQHPSTPRTMSVTFGGHRPADPDPNPEFIANRVAGAFTDSTLQARMDASITLTTIDVTVGPTPDPVIFSKSFGLVGGTAFETPPLNTALLVKKNSAVGGRANRGRFYWPGLIAETDISEVGIIGGASVAAIQTDFDAFLDALGDLDDGDELGIEMVILHDSESPAVTPTPVTSLTVDALAATQRRRMRG